MSLRNPPMPSQYGDWKEWADALVRALSPEQASAQSPQIITNEDVYNAIEPDPAHIREVLEISAENTPLVPSGNLGSDNVQAGMVELQGDIDAANADIADINTDLSDFTAALAGKEPTIAPGTIEQYWRGDKTWQAFPESPDVSSVAPAIIAFLGASTDLSFDMGIGDSTWDVPDWAVDFGIGNAAIDWANVDNKLLEVGTSSDY